MDGADTGLQEFYAPYSAFSDVYDLLMADIPYKRWVDFVLSFCSECGVRPDKILDLGCGTATTTLFMAEAGYETVGIDLSEDMLAIASSKIPFGLKQVPLFCRADMCELSFEAEFDLVTCFCDGINHLISHGDLLRCFKGVEKALKSGGLLVFDLNSPYKISSVLGDNTYFEDFEGGSYVMDNLYEPESHSVQIRLTFFFETETGLYRREDEVYRERWYSHDEIVDALTKAGLRFVGTWEDYNRRKPTDLSERIVYIGKKP